MRRNMCRVADIDPLNHGIGPSLISRKTAAILLAISSRMQSTWTIPGINTVLMKPMQISSGQGDLHHMEDFV